MGPYPPRETAFITTPETPLVPVRVWLRLSETSGSATLIGGAIVLVAITGHLASSTFSGRRSDHP